MKHLYALAMVLSMPNKLTAKENIFVATPSSSQLGEFTWSYVPGTKADRLSLLGKYVGAGIGLGLELGTIPLAYLHHKDTDEERIRTWNAVVKYSRNLNDNFALSALISHWNIESEIRSRTNTSHSLAQFSQVHLIFGARLTEKLRLFGSYGYSYQFYNGSTYPDGDGRYLSENPVIESEISYQYNHFWEFHGTGSYSPNLNLTGIPTENDFRSMPGVGLGCSLHFESSYLSSLSLGYHAVHDGNDTVLLDFNF